jgi:uncharacterized surface protein with fasciclin (FAS1) repeats
MNKINHYLTTLLVFSTILVSIISIFSQPFSVDAFADEKNIFTTIQSDEDLSTFEVILKKAKIEDSISYTDNISVLAPTNGAFNELPENLRSNLLKDENRPKLLEILRYHVILKEIQGNDISDSKTYSTLLGGVNTVSLEKKDNKVLLNNKVEVTNISTSPSNGSIIKINQVIIPKGFDTSSLIATPVTTPEATPRTGGYSKVQPFWYGLFIVLLSGLVYSVNLITSKNN